jgi:acetoin utilization protein AcuC
MTSVAIVYHDAISKYDFGLGHPFRGDRFDKYFSVLKQNSLLTDPNVSLKKPLPANDNLLEMVHYPNYLQEVKIRSDQYAPLSGDTPLSPDIVEAARYIVGASVLAGELVIKKTVKIGEGVGGGLHHAGRGYGGGFCVFNDVAVCAQNLIDNHGIDRVLILDSDVHAGNGTMDIFYNDPRVLFISVHQNPLTIYPGTGFIEQVGEAEGEGFTVNIPLPPGAGNLCMELFLRDILKPLGTQFKPQIILRNGGTDPHFMDGLGSLNLTFEGLWNIGNAVATLSEEVGCGIVNLCCSGYNPNTVATGWFALLKGVMQDNNIIEDPTQSPIESEASIRETERIIQEAKKQLMSYWTFD